MLRPNAWLVLTCVLLACASEKTGGDGSGGDAVCEPGATQACVGPGRCDGVQLCSSEGDSWSACDCGTGGGASGASGTSGSNTGGSGGPTGGNAGMGTGGTGAIPGCDPEATAQSCNGVEPSASGVLIDFNTLTSSLGWTDGSSGGLNGGTSRSPAGVLDLAKESGGVRISGNVPADSSVFLTFYFLDCVDASAFGGLSFPISGSLGGAALSLVVQTNADYPVDTANAKGACSFTSCNTRYTECSSPHGDLEVISSWTTLVLPWAAFAGGHPEANVTPDGLVGLMLDFECAGPAACPVDVALGNIEFMPQ